MPPGLSIGSLGHDSPSPVVVGRNVDTPQLGISSGNDPVKNHPVLKVQAATERCPFIARGASSWKALDEPSA